MRYTFKVGDKYVWNYYGIPPKDFEINAKNKFGMLEDLEEQLGCPLEVIVKALMNGIYNGCGEYLVCSIWNFRGICMLEVSGGSYPTDEYKKTWWLKEDKSE